MNKDYEFCLRCGRRLKNVMARERGYGSVCFEKLRNNTELLHKPLFDLQVHLQSSKTKEP